MMKSPFRADSIISDAPDLALRLRQALAGLPPHERLLLSLRGSRCWIGASGFVGGFRVHEWGLVKEIEQAVCLSGSE